MRLLARSITGFGLRIMRRVGPLHDGDLIEMVVFAAVKAACPPEIFGSEGEGDGVSIGAIARSIGMPAETVRRRVQRLLERGWVGHRGRGVAVSPQWSNAAAPRAAYLAAAAEAERTFQELADFGVDYGVLLGLTPSTPDEPLDGEALGLAIAECCNIFALRAFEAFGDRVGDFTGTLIWMTTLHENTQAIWESHALSWAFADQGAPPPDELRRPIRLQRVSDLTGIPYESVRRQVKTLVARGHMTRTGGGLLVPASVVAGDRLGAPNPAIVMAFLRMVSEIARLGYVFPPPGPPPPSSPEATVGSRWGGPA